MKKRVFLVLHRDVWQAFDDRDAAINAARGVAISTNDEAVVYQAVAFKSAKREVRVDDVVDDNSPAGSGRNPR